MEVFALSEIILYFLQSIFFFRSARTFDAKSDNVGPTSYCQKNQSRSVLDLIRAQEATGCINGVQTDSEAEDVDAYHKRLKMAHLPFRRENSMGTFGG